MKEALENLTPTVKIYGNPNCRTFIKLTEDTIYKFKSRQTLFCKISFHQKIKYILLNVKDVMKIISGKANLQFIAKKYKTPPQDRYH